MIYKKKFKKFKRFDFSKTLGHLLLFRRHSNIFLVLLNNNKKHISTFTSGNCFLGKKKKNKLAVHNMPKIINKLLLCFIKHNIKHLYLYVRHRLGGHFFNLKKLLKKNNIWILRYIYILNKSHGFIRGRKLRRI